MQRKRFQILVCRGPECGGKRSSVRVHEKFESCVRTRAATANEVKLGWQSCFGQCRRGVNVMVREMRPGEDAFFSTFLAAAVGPGAALYHGILPDDVPRILDEHIDRGQVLVELKRRNP